MLPLEDMGLFLVRGSQKGPTRNYVDIQGLYRTGPSPHKMQCCWKFAQCLTRQHKGAAPGGRLWGESAQGEELRKRKCPLIPLTLLSAFHHLRQLKDPIPGSCLWGSQPCLSPPSALRRVGPVSPLDSTIRAGCGQGGIGESTRE